jgi:quercetin dioxygenase-like cupin family protein
MGNSVAFLQLPGTSELRWMGETFTHFLATGDHTAGAFSLVDEQAKRGESVPRHLHRDDVESFYVIAGEITFYLGDDPGVRVGAGGFVHLPGGTIHGFRIESETARYLILTTPRHGQFYRAITLPSRPGGLPPLDSIEGSQIAKACEKFGVEFVGPLPKENPEQISRGSSEPAS